MIDMYPGGTVEMALYDGQRMPWEVANKFDLTGYRIDPTSRGWHVEGGVRARLSGSAPLLTKYPLVFWDQKTNLNSSIHFPAPYERNFSPPKGVLLHFKFFSDFRNSFERIIAEGQHFDQGAYYESLLKHLEGAVTVLEKKSSVEYAGSAQLKQLRFFE